MNPATKAVVIEALEACVWRLKSYDYQAMEGTIAKGEAALALLRSEPEPTPEPGERERFEAWIAKDGGDLSMFGYGQHKHYKNSAVNQSWVAWQARASLPPAPTKGTE
jgi:hypothetical protein